MSDLLQQPDDEALLARVQQDLDTLLHEKITSQEDRALVPLWSVRTRKALQRLVTTGGALDVEALRYFRRDQILVDDLPASDLGSTHWKNNAARNFVVGWRRATRHCLLECLRILQARGFDHLLRKYPCAPVGNPHTFSYKGYRYTLRWARHIYFLGLMNQVLRHRLSRNFAALDIGSSYGIFSSLVKREYPSSHHILVDLPEQLILARYFLATCFPEVRIAGVGELLREPAITKSFVLDHDFVLVPTSLFGRLSANCAELVSNFASFGEMTRSYFERYLQSDVFLSSKYFFTINRIEAYPATFGTDISILDFPITDSQRRLHFGVCPMFSVNFPFHNTLGLFTSHDDPPPYFEYIGRV